MTTEELYGKINGNYTDAKKRMMSDRLVSKFIVKFLNDPSFGELESAMAANDEATAFRAAHTMKGVCANLAITKLQGYASDVTEYLRPGQEAQRAGKDLDAMLAALKQEYALVIAEIKAFAEQ